jgi:hypothetical protein
MTTTAALTVKDAAEKLHTDPRSLRRFLRSRSQGVGTGKRYAIAADALPAMKRDFTAWKKADEAKRAPKSSS